MTTPVRDFLLGLHRLLRHRCFVSGTFVVGVPMADSRFLRFLRDLQAGSTRRLVARTHDDFQQGAAFKARRLCAGACREPSGLTGSGPQMEYRIRPALEGLCGSTAATKRVVLWYHFAVGARRYLFFKLESSPALSMSHVTSAATRYLLKREKSGNGLPKRREDAYKDKAGVDPASALRESRANAADLWPEQAAEAELYDRTTRIGREVFVPAAIASRLLK